MRIAYIWHKLVPKILTIRDYMLKKHFVFTEYRFIFVYLTHKMKIFY